ncbi:MAG: acyl carrier protein [Fuerstiella sp.]
MKTPNNSAAIQDWLMTSLSSLLSVPREQLDPDAPFSKYALDSLDAVTLVMEIEEELGLELPPTLLWDYPTVNDCVSYLLATSQALETANADDS